MFLMSRYVLQLAIYSRQPSSYRRLFQLTSCVRSVQGVLKVIEIVHALNIALEAERVEAPPGGEPKTCIVFGEEPGNHPVLGFLRSQGWRVLRITHPTPYCGGGLRAGWYVQTISMFDGHTVSMNHLRYACSGESTLNFDEWVIQNRKCYSSARITHLLALLTCDWLPWPTSTLGANVCSGDKQPSLFLQNCGTQSTHSSSCSYGGGPTVTYGNRV